MINDIIDALLVFNIVAIVLSVGIIIGEYIIPTFIKMLKLNKLNKHNKVKIDYANKEWIKTIMNFKS